MLAILTLLSVLIVGAASLAAGLWLRSRRVALRRRVLVNLIGGNAVQGVLWSRVGTVLVLKDVMLLERGAEPTQVDGEVLIDRHRVDFVQVL